MLNTKTISRIASIQTLYQYYYVGQDQDISILSEAMILLYKNGELYKDHDNNNSPTLNNKLRIKLKVSYYKHLVEGTVEHLELIDKIITQNLDQGKQFDQLGPLTLALLRVAVYEIKFFEDTPKNVILNEFTNIASSMLDNSEIGFINFILDKIIKEVRNVQ